MRIITISLVDMTALDQDDKTVFVLVNEKPC